MGHNEDFLLFFKLGTSIKDYDLWEKFKEYCEHHIPFLGTSYKSSQESNFQRKDSSHYISEINNKIGQEKESSEFDTKKFQFSHPVYNKLILKLWRELFKDAVVYLKQEDSKERYHDTETFGVDQLFKYFQKFVEFEEVLYENVQFYRDHVFHVFRVFLLGMVVLIDKKVIKKVQIYEEGIFKHLNENIELTKVMEKNGIIKHQEKIAMWIIIALTHDLGYPLEKLSSINRKVRGMLEAFGRSNIQEIEITFPPQGGFVNDFVIKFISTRVVSKLNSGDNAENNKKIKLKDARFGLHLQSKYWIKFSRAFEEYNHSIISCILLMKYLVYFLESDYLLDKTSYLNFRDQRQFQIRREILRSIAVHNCDYIYHLNTGNFGFLLTIVDDLQCWGRPSGRFTRHDSSWEVRLIEYNKEKVDFTIITTEDIDNKELRLIFNSLARKYTKILRGGVAWDRRKFNFSYRIIRKIREISDLGKPRSEDSLIMGLEYTHKLPSKNDKTDYFDVEVNEYYRKNGKPDEEPHIQKKENITINEYLARVSKEENINKLYIEIGD